MPGMLTILETGTFVRNHFSEMTSPLYEALLEIILDPRLYNSFQILWSRYCQLKDGRKLVPLDELINIIEYKELKLLDTGMLAGEMHIDLMMEEGVHFEVYYAPDALGQPTNKLAFLLNGNRYSNFEKVLNELISDEFAQSQFPSGYAAYLKKITRRRRHWWEFWR